MDTLFEFPILSNDADSLVIINLFESDFFDFIRTRKDAVQNLMQVYRNGNEKAGTIIAALLQKPLDSLIHSGSITEEEQIKLFFENAGKNKKIIDRNLCLKWTEPNYEVKNGKHIVSFVLETLSPGSSAEDKLKFEHNLKMKSGFRPSLRDEFLEIEIGEWLRAKNLKLKKSGNNKGMLYRKEVEITFLDEYKITQDKCYRRITQNAKAKLAFEVVSI